MWRRRGMETKKFGDTTVHGVNMQPYESADWSILNNSMQEYFISPIYTAGLSGY